MIGRHGDTIGTYAKKHGESMVGFSKKPAILFTKFLLVFISNPSDVDMAPMSVRISGLQGKHGVFFMRKSTICPNMVLTIMRQPFVSHLVVIVNALDIIIHRRRTSIQCKHMLIIMNITRHVRKHTGSSNYHTDADHEAVLANST